MRIVISIFSLVIWVLCITTTAAAQFYLGPFVGFKASSLEGSSRTSIQGQIQVGPIADGGATGFNAGITSGYQVMPPGMYQLDLNLDVSWSNFKYYQNGYNSISGAGRFTADGFTGGKTNTLSFDIMPINRLDFGDFILSPYGGLGLNLNLMMTSDMQISNPQFSGTFTGTNDFKMGLIFFYGTLFKVSEIVQPFIQFKHLIPFGDETEFTTSFQSQAGGTQNNVHSIADVPGFFNLVGGVRFNLN